MSKFGSVHRVSMNDVVDDHDDEDTDVKMLMMRKHFHLLWLYELIWCHHQSLPLNFINMHDDTSTTELVDVYATNAVVICHASPDNLHGPEKRSSCLSRSCVKQAHAILRAAFPKPRLPQFTLNYNRRTRTRGKGYESELMHHWSASFKPITMLQVPTRDPI